MKNTLKLLIFMFTAMMAGCIEDNELEPPEMTLSYCDTQYVKFSWREPAVINVKLKSEEDIERFTLTSKPAYWNKDTTFPPYTHYVDFDLNLSLGRGYVVEDSTVILTFKAYCNGLCNEQFRKLKYEFNYPAIDSFEVEMSPDPVNGKCLLDIESQAAYKYTEYRNRNFDLVMVKEDRVMWRNFGLGLASPASEHYLYEYFAYRVPQFEYNAELCNVPLRETLTGTYIESEYQTWADLTPKLLDTEEHMFYRYLAEDEAYGFGLSNLEIERPLYKVKLYNGKKAMIRITNILDGDYPVVTMTVYYQKE